MLMRPSDKPVIETQRKWHYWAWLGGPPIRKGQNSWEHNFYGVHKERKCSQHPQKSQRTPPFEHQPLISSHPPLTSIQPAALHRNIVSFSESDGSPFDFYRKRKVLRTETIISTLTSWGRENSRGWLMLNSPMENTSPHLPTWDLMASEKTRREKRREATFIEASGTARQHTRDSDTCALLWGLNSHHISQMGKLRWQIK